MLLLLRRAGLQFVVWRRLAIAAGVGVPSV